MTKNNKKVEHMTESELEAEYDSLKTPLERQIEKDARRAEINRELIRRAKNEI